MVAYSLPLLLLGTAAAAAPPTVTLRNGVKMPMIAAGTGGYNSSEAFASITAALSVGFTMVDTALDYGCQDGVGRAIAQFPRESFFLETKVPGCVVGGTTLNPLHCYQDAKKNLATDLKLLNVSYVDLAIIHFPPLPAFALRSCSEWSGSCSMIRSQWKALEEFYKAGKAKAIGVSNYCPSCFACLKDAEIFPMVNQAQYHLGMGTDAQGFASFAKQHGVVLQGYSVLAESVTTQKASDEILHGNLTTSIGKAHGKSSVQVALKWVVEQGIPAVTKSSNPKHLAEDLDLWSWDFSPEELEALNQHATPAGSPSFACSAADAATFV